MPNPANLSCSQCHASAPNDYTPATLASVAALHGGITGNCGLCHGSTSSALTWFNNFTPRDAILAPSHIPYLSGADCGSCHAKNYVTGGFGPMNMTQATHAFVPTACAACHEAGLSFTMGAASPPLQGRPADHTQGLQVAPNDCGLCHNTANWNSSSLPAGHMPNPGNQGCTVCHTAAPANYTTLASIAVLHTGITGGCGQCHGASTQLTFYNNTDNPKDGVLTPAHIPYISGTDCASCHAKNYVAGGFGPMNMTQATHAFVPTACASCHEAGSSFYMGAASPVLQGRPADHTQGQQVAPNDCSLCHTTANWISTVLPAGHMPNPANLGCATCHTAAPTNYATLASIAVLHTGITGSCGQCHGAGTQLTFYNNNDNPKDNVLTPAHIPYSTGTDCSNCHTANYVAGGFGPTNMSAAKHAFVPTTCDTCHEAGLNFYLGASTPALQGRPADHMPPNGTPQQQTGDCSGCHETTDWNSTALPAGHMPNPGNQQCTVCHTAAPGNYAPLASNAVLHTGISTGCAQCHGGATALTFYNNNDNPKSAVLSPPHIPAFSGTDCSSCHSSTTYAAGSFGPMNMTQATHSGVGSSCNPCHEAGRNFYMGAASPTLQGRPADHTAGQQVAPNDCNLCHTTAGWGTNTLPAGHMPNPASQTCNVCHTAAPANYATLASIAVLHTGISSGCNQCHGGTTQLTFYNNNDNPKAGVLTPAHIAYLAGTDCGSCHAKNYVAGGFGPMNMTQATHAFVATTCASCHEAGLSFYMGAANPALQGRPADHTQGQQVAPNDCSLCHTTANWNSNALPAGHMPNPGNQACAVCHTAAPTNYATLASITILHTGITSGCNQCHGGTTQLTFYNNNDNPKAGVLTPSHLPYLSGTDCASCHAKNYVAGGFGRMNMSQATHAFVSTTCITCHEKGLSFYMGAASPALQGRPADHTSGQMVAVGHMPNPANQGCTVCHTAAPANYATLAANPVLHTGITTGCITCHGAPNATPPVFYLNYTPKDAVLSPVHIPTAATACERCHAISFTSFSGTTMSAAKHTSMFAVIGGTCDACHESGRAFYGVNNLTTRPSGHHVGQDCSKCHSPNNWDGNAANKAAKIKASSGRSTISAVVTAPVASAGASPALARTPLAGSMLASAANGSPSAARSHAGVTHNCVTCHNGTLAAGKPATHVASNSSCENCHTTVAWLPARFDHQGVKAGCASCHNGVHASGKPMKHVPTTQDCGACHGVITWAAATFNHLGIGAICASCHNGITATGKQPQHPITTLDCGSCHNTLTWTSTSLPPAQRRPVTPAPRGTNSTR
jgi:hypothetical protein